MAQRVTDLILNGDFSIGGSGNWSNWSSVGAFDASGTSTAILTDDSVAGVLTYSGLEGLDTGPGANGAGRLSLDLFWEDDGGSGSSTTVEIRVAGVVLATITTPAGAGTTASIVYANGASGNLASLSESGFQTLVIELPASIPSTGSLQVAVTPGSGVADNVRIDNVSLEVTETIPDTVDAVDDQIGVLESEGSGDTDGNVLSNDTAGTAAVIAVDGSALNVGIAVAGSGGGTFTIDAAGAVDFDAAGAFESLGAGETAVSSVTYTIEEQTPFDPGSQSAETSTQVGPSDQQAFFTVTANEFSNDGTADLSGLINLSGITQPTYNILFVMDVSGSTGFSSPTFPGVGDLNGDGDSDEVIDAEIAAFRKLSTDIADLGFSNSDLQIGFVTFESASSSDTQIVLEGAGDQSFDAGSTSLSNALNPGAVGGGTDFERALQLAITWFNGQPAREHNIVYFLSDGEHNGGTFTDEVATLQASGGINADIHAVGISSGASLTQLNQMDNTVSAGQTAGSSAVRITTLAELDAALEPPFLAVSVTDFRVFVDGVQDLGYDASDLTVAGTGFTYNIQDLANITQVPGTTSTVRLEVEFDDGTVLTNVVEIEAQPQSSDTATVSVTVTGVNDGPVAIDDQATVGEDGPAVSIDLTGNDSDPDVTDDLEILSVSGGTGTVAVNPDGDSVTYDPNGQFEGLGAGESAIDTFTYVVTDGNGGTDTATVSVTVTGVNDGPDAIDDQATVGEDGPAVTIDLTGNDSDPDVTDDLEILSVSGGTGTVAVNPDGDSVTYDPNGQFEGLGAGESAIDTFTYVVTDGNGGTDTATVSVTVTGVNDGPDAIDDQATVGEDGPAVSIDLTGNDSDPDVTDDLEILSVSGGTGTVAVNPDGDSVTYDPNGQFEGLGAGESAIDTFTYVVTDGNGGTDTATVSVTVTGVNDGPDAIDDQATVGEDGPAVTIDLTGNDSDPDVTDDLEILSVSGGTGTVAVNPDGDSVTYDPNGQFEGLGAGESAIDTFTYVVTDGNGGTDTATVSVTVTGVNDGPVAVDDQASAGAVGAVTIDLTGNDFDPDVNDDLEILSVDTTGTLGSVTVNPDDDSVSYDADGAFVGLADGETAIDTFTYVVTDGNGGTDTATVSVTVTGGNETPDAIDDQATVGEDGPAVTIDLTGNDSDPDVTDDLEILSVSGGTGTVAVNPDGDSVTYDPNGQFEGLGAGESAIDTFTYVVTDGNGGTDTATVSVTVTGVNDGPDAIDDQATVGEDGPAVSIDLTGNDSDPDVTDDLEILSVSGGTGTVAVNPDGDSVTYDPNGQFEGLGAGESAIDTFTYVVTDGNGGTDTATVSVTVTGVNDGPVAVDDQASAGAVGAVTIDLTGNDSDPDVNDDLEILSVDTTGTLGSVTVNPDDDSVSYDANGAFVGLADGETAIDTFTYVVTDGNGGTDTATVSVTVTGGNETPDAIDDQATVGEDGPAVTIDLTGNDSDPDVTDDLEILSVSGGTGTVAVNPDGDSVTYDPNGQFEGLGAGESAIDTFTYVVTDGNGGTDTATVSVTVTGVNDGPVAVDDQATVGEDGPAVSIDLTGNDSDPDVTDDLEILSVSGGTGTVAVNPDGDSVTYDPNGQFEGLGAGESAIDTFTYVVTDGNGGTDTATVSVTVTGVNDGPVAVDDQASAGAVGAVTIDLTGNDSDPDVNDDLEILSVDTTGTLGSVTVNPDDDSVSYDANGAFVGLADGETAIDTFTYVVTDGNGGTDTATVSVTVTGGNETPDAIDDQATVGEDGPAVTIDLTGNDSDPDVTDDLEILSVSGGTGTVAVNPDGDSVTYDPNGQFEGLGAGESAIDTFTYVVTDGNGGTDTATVSVTVTGVNDGPDAIDDQATVGEDGPAVSIDLTGNDSDPDVTDDLEILSVSGGTGTVAVNPDGDSVTYDPNGQFEGLGAGESAIDTFTYVVTDGNGGTDTATVSVTVTGVNDGPDAIDDQATVGEDGPAVTIDLTGNDFDPDVTDDLEILSVSGGTGTVAVNPDGDSVTYDPNGQFEGLGAGESAIDTFTYVVTDGNGGTDTATVSVTVTGVNDGPVAIDDQATVGEDGPAVTIDLTGNDSDPDVTDDLEILSVSGGTGTVAVNPDGDSVTYDPNGQFEGLGAGESAIDTFTYVVTDGNGGQDTATVSVTVTGVNDGPDAIDDQAGTNSDATVTVVVTGNDSDPDVNDDLEILSFDTSGTLGLVTAAGDGDTLIYDPNGAFDALGQGDSAIDTFTYVVTDGNGGTDTATVTVTVGGVNDPPDALDDATIGFQDRQASYNVLVNDSDPNLDPLTLTAATLATPGAGTVTFNAGGTVTLTPGSTFSGPALIDYTISDGRGGTDTATLTINVIPNSAPVIQEPVSFIVNENATLAANLQGTDPENDPLTWSISGGVDAALFNIDPGTGQLSFITPPDFEAPADANGDNRYQLQVRLSDPYGSTTQAILVTVQDVVESLPPTAVDDTTIGFQAQQVTYDVLANDSDPDGDPLSVTGAVLSNPGQGSVTVNPNDTITFTPDPLTTGPVGITYTVSDGLGGTDTATLTINMIANGAPVIQEPVSFEVLENQTLAADLQATDPENDPLTWSITGGPDAAQFTIDPGTGVVSFVGVPDFEAPTDANGDNRYQFSVRVADEFGSATQSILVTVLDENDTPNDPPVFTQPQHPPGQPAVIVLTGQSGTGGSSVGSVLADDPDQDTLEYSLFGEDANLFVIDAATGAISFLDPQATGASIPRSLDGDRIYELDVLVIDGNGGSAVLDLDLPLFLGG